MLSMALIFSLSLTSISIQILGAVTVFFFSAALALRKEAWDQAPSAPSPPPLRSLVPMRKANFVS